MIVKVLMLKLYQKVRADLGNSHKRLFDLHGIHIDAFNDQHIVRAALDTGDSAMRAAAGAGFGNNRGNIF